MQTLHEPGALKTGNKEHGMYFDGVEGERGRGTEVSVRQVAQGEDGRVLFDLENPNIVYKLFKPGVVPVNISQWNRKMDEAQEGLDKYFVRALSEGSMTFRAETMKAQKWEKALGTSLHKLVVTHKTSTDPSQKINVAMFTNIAAGLFVGYQFYIDSFSIHGDLHNGNVHYDKASGTLKFIDYDDWSTTPQPRLIRADRSNIVDRYLEILGFVIPPQVREQLDFKIPRISRKGYFQSPSRSGLPALLKVLEESIGPRHAMAFEAVYDFWEQYQDVDDYTWTAACVLQFRRVEFAVIRPFALQTLREQGFFCDGFQEPNVDDLLEQFFPTDERLRDAAGVAQQSHLFLDACIARSRKACGGGQ